jgi:hypothetical protein
MLFYLSFVTRPDAAQVTQPLEHQVGFCEVTGLKIVSPQAESASPAVAALEQLGIATFASGDVHCMEIEFDGGVQDNMKDFRPHLPLIFHW